MKLLRLTTVLLFFKFLITNSQTVNFTEWENQQVNQINCEPVHATFIPYKSDLAAIQRKCDALHYWPEFANNFAVISIKSAINCSIIV
jgi:hypothetical protein